MEANYRVGQFILERKLGEGGMAEVWLGRNVHLGTPIAAKFFTQQYVGNSEISERFLNEAKRQGSLDHPNIIKVYGYETVGDRSFLILQYIDGESLDDYMMRLNRQPVPMADVAKIASGVLYALQYAHNRNIVHRDVKPSNILLDSSGNPYLGDFGLVLALNEKRLTRTGTVMGTPHYMSPEQIARPGEVDHRSDIYSFGCVLYEMLTGRTPFESAEGETDTDFNIKLAHTTQTPRSLREHNPSLPAALDNVVLTCLAKQPAGRYASADQLREALFAALGSAEVGSGGQHRATVAEAPILVAPAVREPQYPSNFNVPPQIAPPPPVQPRSKAPMAVAALLICAVAAFAGYKMFGPQPDGMKKELIAENDTPPIVVPPKEEEKIVVPPKTDDKPTVVESPKDTTPEKKTEKKKDERSKKEDLPKVVVPEPEPKRTEEPIIEKPVEKPAEKLVPLQNTLIRANLLDAVSTEKSDEGDRVRATIVSPARFNGAILEGVVAKSKKKGRFSRSAELALAFHTLRMGNQERKVNVQVVAIRSSKGVDVDEEGQMIERSNGLKKLAIFAAAGSAVGAVIRGAKGAVTGAAAGAGASVVHNGFISKGPNVAFASGTQMELEVSERQ